MFGVLFYEVLSGMAVCAVTVNRYACIAAERSYADCKDNQANWDVRACLEAP